MQRSLTVKARSVWHSCFNSLHFGLAWLAFSWTGSTLVSVITFFVSIIILIYKIKKRMQTELFLYGEINFTQPQT
ncbi:Uncharacterised protein [Klebsiella pneumoniae]|nr:Uncharacterised protein [Klebsiella pneumoniae]